MPRIKIPDPPFSELRRLLLGYEIDSVRMSAALGVCRKTGKQRLDHPEELTLDDLKRLCHRWNIPADEIREAIKF